MDVASATVEIADRQRWLRTTLTIVLEGTWWCVVGLACGLLILALLGRLQTPSVLYAWSVVLVSVLPVIGLRCLPAPLVFVPGRVARTGVVVPAVIATAMLVCGVPWWHAVCWVFLLGVMEFAWWRGRGKWLWHPLPAARVRGESRQPQLRLTSVEVLPGDANVQPLQETTRYVSNGVEIVYGRWRFDYAAGTRRLVLHVPIHPPLKDIPTVDVQAYSTVEVLDCRITHKEVFGIRVEVGLATPAVADGHGWLEFLVQAPVNASVPVA